MKRNNLNLIEIDLHNLFALFDCRRRIERWWKMMARSRGVPSAKPRGVGGDNNVAGSTQGAQGMFR